MSVSSTALKRRQDIIVPENTKTNSITISSGATTGYVLFSSDNLGNSQWINPESVSGLSGSSGTSGKSGSSGTSGTTGTSGTNGVSGTSGTSGTTGASGTSGTSGKAGTSGTTGTSGTAGSSGEGFVTITNPANDRILTSLGTDDTANAEQNMTFDGNKLTITGSGGTVMDVQGSLGQLFSITDSLTGDILTVSDISGIPILTVNSDDLVTIDGQLLINSYYYSSITSGTTLISTVSMSDASAAFFDYYVKDGENMRMGTLMVVWTSIAIQFTDYSTDDIGDTSSVKFTVAINGTNIQVSAVITSGSWIIKTSIRLL